MKIKINDNVKVLSGKEAGKTGRVVQVFPAEKKLVVEGLNIITKHLRAPRRGEPGRIIELSGPIFQSKVMLVCPKCGKPTRVGAKLEGSIKKRQCRKCQEVIE